MENALRKTILPFVNFTGVRTDKFKTGCLSITLRTQLSRKNAARNALLPSVLLRGCARYPDMTSLSAAMDELYGAHIEPMVRKKGEVQCIGFYADFIDDSFVPGGGVLEKVADLLGQIILFPATRGGLLNQEYVRSERENLRDRINSRINDKQQYAMFRLKELMCPGEAFAIDSLGEAEDALNISPITLTKHYRKLLETSEIEVFYCGSTELKKVESIVIEALSALPRQEDSVPAVTDIKTETAEVRYFTDSLDVTQGKLTLGFRFSEPIMKLDRAAVTVFNAIYGGSVSSRLFLNVREKLSLCYYASSSVEWQKGLMFVSSGIEISQYDAALGEILSQLDGVKKGELTADELDTAKKSVANALKMLTDSQISMENFYLGQALDGMSYGPEMLEALAEGVTAENVVSVAGKVRLDSVYFLRGIAAAERSV
jgi:predicted Zn-dependent peptidase